MLFHSVFLYTGTTNLARKSKILQSIGIVYLNAGAVPVAEEFFQEAEQIATKSHDLPTQARAKLNLGNLYRFKELYTAALEYLLDGLALAQKANDSVSLPAFYGNIALIYDNERNLPLAMEYYNKARQIFESAGNKLNAGRCLYNIAVLYRTQGAYEKSYALYDTVWQIFSEIGYKRGLCSISFDIGISLQKQKKPAAATLSFLQCQKTALEAGDREHDCSARTRIAEIFYQVANNEIAPDSVSLIRKYFDRYPECGIKFPSAKNDMLRTAKKIVEQLLPLYLENEELSDLSNNYLLLSRIDFLHGDYEGAFKAHQQYARFEDSLNSANNSKTIARLQVGFEYGKREDSLKAAHA
ncbi:MAG: hypothetical protein EBZ77_16475, partial [Chitinophagia bacterium]|nr:hypothetical protein [Chitinophagia bacterium]